jgi:uncharacterized protein (TIGR02677 family)
MFEQHRIFNNNVLPSDIFKHLFQFPQFSDYTIEELESDLIALVAFGNMEEMQDTTEASSIEEFKKNRKRYKLKDYTIELEKMLIIMEKNLHHIRGGSLERTLTDKLLSALMELNGFIVSENLDKSMLVKLNEIWEESFERFTKLDNDASSYLSHISGDKLENLMQTDEFVVFKTEFISYLTDFVVGLKKNGPLIERAIRNLSGSKIKSIIKELVRYQRTIPKTELIPENEFFNAYQEAWTGIHNWFIENETSESKVYYLENRTNDAIGRISRLAQHSAERQLHKRNRKTDFLHLAKMVHQQQDLEESHAMFAYLFGFEGVKRVKASDKKSDSSSGTLWEHEPDEVHISYRIRPQTEKAQKRALKVREVSLELLEQKRKYDEQKIYEEQKIQELLLNKSLSIRDMGLTEPFIRTAILNWIGRAMLNHVSYNVYEGRTEYGIKYRMHKNSDEIVELHCIDGVLRMPDYEFSFSEVFTG